MYMYNIVGTQKGTPYIVTRSVEEKQENMKLTPNHRQMTEYVTNGDNISFTQTIELVDSDEGPLTVVNSTVWSPFGPLLRTQDARLRFLRFTQRDSIMFVGIDKDERFLVEAQLTANKYSQRTHSEMHFCKPKAADAIDKYIWVINTDNQVELHNVTDKESYKMNIAPHWEPHAILGMSTDGRSATVIATHTTKHYAAMLSYEVTAKDLVHTDTREVLSSMRFQPGTLVQSKGCVMFTVKNAAAQKRNLVIIGNYGGNVFFNTAEVNFVGAASEPITKVVFSDIAINNTTINISVLLNLNMYSMWSFNMNTAAVHHSRIFTFPSGLSDFIVDRVVLMRGTTQVALELTPSTTLVSAHVTDMITSRMRHQLEIATNTARSMVGRVDTTKAVASVKELGILREESDRRHEKLVAEHLKVLKRMTSDHATATLQLEERLADMTTQRDARVTTKQYNTLKTQLEHAQRDKARIEQTLEAARKDASDARTSTTEELRQLQHRIKVLLAERETLKSDVAAERESRGALRAQYTDQKAALQKQLDVWEQQAGTLSGQVGVLEQRAAERDEHIKQLERRIADMEREKQILGADNLLLSAQLADTRTRMAESEQMKQLTLQMEAAQNRSRLQYETMQREIDSLRRANYTISQSYQMLQSVTKFGFLPDGTSLETALQMMRNLTVFQQDLAALREENTELRKKVVVVA